MIRTLFLVTLLLIVYSCATNKKPEEIGKVGKLYHNTTAKFNGYFNANVLLTESIAKLNTDYQDNYNRILAIYPYVASQDVTQVSGDLDEAIKKSAVAVSLHRVSHWTDDCYLLIGKAQYLKKDYEDAEDTFKYLKKEYSPEAMAAREALNKKTRKKKKRRKRAPSAKKKKKKKSSKKSKKKSSSKKSSGESAKDKKKKAKSQAQKRKEYNKEVQRKKKERAKNRGSKKKKSTEKEETTPPPKEEKVETPSPATPSPELNENAKTVSNPVKKKAKEEREDSDPDKYFLKHRPAYQEGLFWLARTYIERENFAEADYLLGQLEKDPKTFDDIYSQIHPLRAYLQMRQKKYDAAIPHLNDAIALTKKRKEKARYAYIIAQIHQEAGRGQEAFAAYEEALKYSTSYEMEFSARLNIAMNGWRNGLNSAEVTQKTLTKMTKDIKNEEYRDQIYYALAEIALANNDRAGGIENLRLSLAYNTSNPTQKAESYLQLAELYFEDQQYVYAKSYFDSTLQVLPKTDARFDRVTKFSNNLTGIAENLTIIAEQDSLLALSKMSDKDRKALAYKIKKEEDEARLAKIKEGAEEKFDPKKGSGRNIRRSTSSSRVEPSTFFAYNDKTVKKGKKDFDKRWDRRPLEDNWRRSSRTGLRDIEEEEIAVQRAELELTDDDIKKIFKDVPSTPEGIKVVEKKIDDALFKLGQLYRERLDNNAKSVEALEELLKRFPETEHELDAWYYLYLAHTDLGNKAEAKIYFDKIVEKYPTTTYARVLTDPNFLQSTKDEERKLVIYYNATYDHFDADQHQKAKDRIAKVEELFGNKHSMKAKFALLNSLCIGKLEGKEAYIKSLKEVVAKYPKTDEEKRAKEILRLLNAGVDEVVNNSQSGDEKSKYKVEDNKVHYFIVVLDKGGIKLTDAKNTVSNYNKKYHKLDRLRISNIYLGAKTDTPILVIRRFKKKEEAMQYYNGILTNKAEFLGEDAEYQIFAVTQHNYRQILKSKSLDGYDEFFQQNYLD